MQTCVRHPHPSAFHHLPPSPPTAPAAYSELHGSGLARSPPRTWPQSTGQLRLRSTPRQSSPRWGVVVVVKPAAASVGTGLMVLRQSREHLPAAGTSPFIQLKKDAYTQIISRPFFRSLPLRDGYNNKPRVLHFCVRWLSLELGVFGAGARLEHRPIKTEVFSLRMSHHQSFNHSSPLSIASANHSALNYRLWRLATF